MEGGYTDLFSTEKGSNVVEIKMPSGFQILDNKAKDVKVQFIQPEFRGKNGLVMFYAPWCPHCQNMASTWLELANVTKGLYPVGAVNCDDSGSGNNLLSDYFKVAGYPTIKIWNGSEFTDYSGGRELKDFLQFLCTSNGLCDLV